MPEERRIGAGASASSGSAGSGGRGLAVIPVLVALMAFALLIPRSAVPEAVPMPAVNARELAKTAAHDRELADAAQRAPLPGEVRALGSAIRAFNTAEAKDADMDVLGDARAAIDKARPAAIAAGMGALAELRAVQAEAFLDEVRRFEATRVESDELQALGGSFVRRMKRAGWCDANDKVVLDEAQRRVAFEATWNAVVGLEAVREMALTLDEERALYTLYLAHPHAPEAVRDEIDMSRGRAPSERVCRELDHRERSAVEGWRLEKVKKLGALDATYPTTYAIGVVQYRRGEFPAAAEAFRTWLSAHPDGAYAVTARNFLKASIEAAAY